MRLDKWYMNAASFWYVDLQSRMKSYEKKGRSHFSPNTITVSLFCEGARTCDHPRPPRSVLRSVQGTATARVSSAPFSPKTTSKLFVPHHFCRPFSGGGIGATCRGLISPLLSSGGGATAQNTYDHDQPDLVLKRSVGALKPL